jgi:CubicO group peptidase (beta-lactamase class C family)
MASYSAPPEFGGFVAPGFEAVAEHFRAQLEERELGAAFAAARGGELVVDLWGGLAERSPERPWEGDTLGVIFSGTKALTALCVLALIEEGALDLEAPLARYWPEFAAAGKGDVLLRHAVSHQAGLPGLRTSVALAQIPDSARMASLLAAEEPFWPPGERVVYHSLTYGWLCGEVVRRVSGESLGAFWRRRFAEPLGLEVWIGLPAELEARVAHLELAEDWAGPRGLGPVGEISPEHFAAIAENPDLFAGPELAFNRRSFHAGEIPGAGGIASARSLAKLYGVLAAGGEYEGVQILAPETIELGQRQIAEGIDPVDGDHLVYGVGWALQNQVKEFGPPERAFGHGGAGGSRHGGWPAEGVGFSYVMNQMREHREDRRAEELLAVLHSCL